MPGSTPAPAPLAGIAAEARVLGKATLRAARYLDIPDKTLARIIGVSGSSISRLRSDAYSLAGSAKAFELAALFVRLFRGLDAIAGGDDEFSRSWLVAENAALRGRPLDLIQTAHGLVSAIAYVDSRRAPL